MSTQFRAPGRYVQEPGLLADASDHLAVLDASRAVVAGGSTALATAGADLHDGLEAAGITRVETIEGVAASTSSQIDEIRAAAVERRVDLVVGVGGGTAIDAAKGASVGLDCAFVSVPTIASTDAPASGVAVVYDDAGRPIGGEYRDRSPELVLVDTDLIAAAPVEFLRWGLGDALATTFEAEACAASGARTPHDTAPSDAGLTVARRCHEVIDRHGPDALAAVERDQVTPAVTRIVETALLHSTLGFENAGVAGAHSLEIGCRYAGHTDAAHGELVGVCTLAQLVVEDHAGRDDFATLLVELGFGDPLPEGETLSEAAELACSDATMMANEPVDVTPEAAAAALREARDSLVRARA